MEGHGAAPAAKEAYFQDSCGNVPGGDSTDMFPRVPVSLCCAKEVLWHVLPGLFLWLATRGRSVLGRARHGRMTERCRVEVRPAIFSPVGAACL